MRSVTRTILLALLVALCGSLAAPAAPARAETPRAINRTWLRTDYSVSTGRVSRTWMWGPNQVHTGSPATEPYEESPNGQRQVFYFDKSRMEITDPNGDQNSTWYVTNGLLVRELVTGEMQVGNNRFEKRLPAQVNVAGDADDPTGPTYETFAKLLNAAPAANGATIIQRVDRSGTVLSDGTLAGQNVTAAYHVSVPGLDHQVASPFWAFMNSEGEIYEDGFKTARLFVDPFYATGYPITEPYWANVKVANTYRDVLMQCFERRCLTYTPGNPPGWQVEAGNVGQHYYAWRYQVAEGQIVYQPDLSQLTPVNQGAITGAYDPGTSSWVLTDATELTTPGSGSGYTVQFPSDAARPASHSLSVTVVTLNNDTTYQSEAAVYYRLDTSGNTILSGTVTVLGMDGLVVSYYQNFETGEISQLASTSAASFHAGNGAENTVKVIVRGGQATVYLNDDFVQAFALDPGTNLSANGFGFAVFRLYPGDQPSARFGFKNVIVRELLNP